MGGWGLGGGGGWGAVAPPTFGQQQFFRGFHTPLTESYHQKCANGFFYVSHIIMVMSDKTAIFQLKSQ